MKKYFIFLFAIFSLTFSLPALALTSSSGFIPGQIWYSKEPLVEGETVNIHTAVWNGEKNSLTAKVEFYDKNVILGSRDVVLTPSELKDVFVSWKITSGDHIISAKIISSVETVFGKKENITLERNVTGNNKQFVSVTAINSQGKIVTGDSALQKQLDKTASEINSVIPENVSTSVTLGLGVVDNFRGKIFTEVTTAKEDTLRKIDTLDSKDKTVAKVNTQKDIFSATEKPIAYIKLFLLSVVAFIFSNRVVFYALSVLIIFVILRFIYRKIRNR